MLTEALVPFPYNYDSQRVRIGVNENGEDECQYELSQLTCSRVPRVPLPVLISMLSVYFSVSLCFFFFFLQHAVE